MFSVNACLIPVTKSFLGVFIFTCLGRLYAMERGLRIPPSERTKTTNSLLISLMNQLEKVFVLGVVEEIFEF